MTRQVRQTAKHLLLARRRNATMEENFAADAILHKDSMCRVEHDSLATSYSYVIVISIPQDNDCSSETSSTVRELHFSRHDFDFGSRLFAILDTESLNVVHRNVVQKFVHMRCPVVSKRDDDLYRLGLRTRGTDDPSLNTSPTFDEIWKAMVACSRHSRVDGDGTSDESLWIGVEGWLVFCRFIALAQYLEAKRRFSARHLQQTMRHRNAPRGSEMVVIDFPPPEPPAPITPQQLFLYEKRNENGLPLPELDLDHSLLAAHDAATRRRLISGGYQPNILNGRVKLDVFGASRATGILQQPNSTPTLDFAVTFSRRPGWGTSDFLQDETVVRRSMADMMWLDDTFASHRVLGGTLCGRILPPFPSPSSHGGGSLSHFPMEDSRFNSLSLKNTTGNAIHAAAAGVGRMRDAAKSFIGPIGSYLKNTPTDARSDDALAPSTSISHALPSYKMAAKTKRILSLTLPENYYNPNSSEGKARRLERYLNYLLEHPALSTSFPLNAILTSSQSGLDAARQCLEEYSLAEKELKSQTPNLDDGKLGISLSTNFAWVRTAAQAAVALQVHGILETTGMQSASARLQHASLPAFGSYARSSGWDEVDNVSPDNRGAVSSDGDRQQVKETQNFEDGVVYDEGFDLLPLPVPAPERRILTVGSTGPRDVFRGENRFHYGSGDLEGTFPFEEDHINDSAFLGDISVDENIDKLREVIGSVDNTLCRCLASAGKIGKAKMERFSLHLNIIRGLDSLEGMRGRFISQRPLMRGVAGVEQSKEVLEESDLSLIDDLSWQTSLASSAVSAAEGVRAAVRVARTASNARAATSAAACTAQSACEREEFLNLDEARAAQTRMSIAQSHAIHAAVVEHEAKTVKRRATLALANDVKVWNVHRKREMLISCISFARSQHEAARRSVDAWSTLRDGFIGAPVCPSVFERKPNRQPVDPVDSSPEVRLLVEPGEVTAVIYEDVARLVDEERPRTIVAIEHNTLANSESTPSENLTDLPSSTDLLRVSAIYSGDQEKSEEIVESEAVFPFGETSFPFAEAAPVRYSEGSDLMKFSFVEENNTSGSNISHGFARETTVTDEKMSASMQSLVEGLMNWGDGFEAEEDHFALPAGMAASIAMEESCAFGTPNAYDLA